MKMKLPKSLSGIPFYYVAGVTLTTGVERVYQNKEYGLQINIETPRKKGVWGKGVKSFSVIGEKEFFDSYEELLKARGEQ